MIEGVVVTPLKLIPNERGRLMEVQSRDDPNFPGFGQVYVTQSLPGIVKAWYRHKKQIDQLAVITGRANLVLYDDREASPTKGAVEEYALNDTGEQKLVLIPPGLWHGFQALGDTPTFFLHLNNEPFAFDDTDEERLPADSPLIPHQW